ncbi:uncharacterized protein [Dermacentor albipictus]|uniref:uncharacterized protein isoform X2 n=1 Tax=Dermacentor albipictus TaxID=60249 RepID=UPI0038FCF617
MLGPRTMPMLLHCLILYIIPISTLSWAQYHSQGDRPTICRRRYTVTWNTCYYKCITDTHNYYQKYPDGTQCVFSRQPVILGRCLHGHCRKGASRPTRPSYCPPPQQAGGYVTGCQYPCSGHPRKMGAHPSGTPCIQLNRGGRLQGKAGICKNGECVAYDLLDDPGSIKAVAEVFAPKYKQCPDKEHLGKNALFDCRRYCKIKDGWYFGFYTSNSTCQFLDRNRLGWCCNGKCHEKMHCA